eukprot:5988564-Pyramimonas_sp.AAC.1
MASKTALGHPKRAPSRPREALTTASEGVRRDRRPPRRPKEALRWPKTAQDAAKRSPRRPKRPPR